METDTRQILTQETIRSILLQDCSGNFSTGNDHRKTAYLIFFFGVAVSGLTSSFFPLIFSLIPGIYFLSSGKSKDSICSAILNRRYRLYEDICLEKRHDVDSDEILGLGTFKLKMQTHGWIILPFDCQELFEATAPGDPFYLVCVPKNSPSGKVKPIHWFNARQWVLDTNEFAPSVGYFVPKQT